MVEDIEELRVEAHLHVLAYREPLGEIEVVPDKSGAAQCVPGEVTELAVLRTVAARASSGAWIHCGDEGVRIKPLEGSRLRDSRNRVMLVKRHTRNDARELWAAALDDALSVRRIRRAQH